MLLLAATSSNGLMRTQIISHVSQWQQIRHQSYDKTSFEYVGELLEHADVVWGVAFSKDSQLIATGCWDNLIRTWTVPQSKSEKESQQARVADSSPDSLHVTLTFTP
jgi:WD40 repeat protein